MGQRECFLMCCWKSSMNPGEKRSARLDGTDCTRRAMSAFTGLVNRVPIPATTFALASLGLGGTAADRNAVDDAFFASGLKDCAKRLAQKVRRAGSQGAYAGGRRRIRGHDNDRDIVVLFPEKFQQFDATHARHLYICNNAVSMFIACFRDKIVRRAIADRLHAEGAHQTRQRVPHRTIVIYHCYLADFCHSASLLLLCYFPAVPC